MDNLNWLGWLFVIDMVLSTVVHLLRAARGGVFKDESECFWSAVACFGYLMGFIFIGFTK